MKSFWVQETFFKWFPAYASYSRYASSSVIDLAGDGITQKLGDRDHLIALLVKALEDDTGGVVCTFVDIVEQDDGAVADAGHDVVDDGIYLLLHHLGGVLGLVLIPPVLRVHVPQDDRVGAGRGALVGDRTADGAHEGGDGTVAPLTDDLSGFGQLKAVLGVGAGIVVHVVGVAVNGDLVTLTCNEGHGITAVIGVAVHAVADDEEGGGEAVTAQLVDDLLGPDVVGTVVKGDGYPFLGRVGGLAVYGEVACGGNGILIGGRGGATARKNER